MKGWTLSLGRNQKSGKVLVRTTLSDPFEGQEWSYVWTADELSEFIIAVQNAILQARVMEEIG